MTEPTEPLVLGMVQCTNDEYHAGPGISKSHLDVIAKGSPKHYWYKYLNPDRVREEPTPQMVMGTAVHTAILEPDLFPSEVIESPEFDRRSKNGRAEYEDFKLQNVGRIVLSPEDYKTCLSVRDAVYAHPLASALMNATGQAEQSFYAIDTETGELIKCRTDYMHETGEIIVDVKTTEDASPTGFAKSCANFRYPVQPAHYNHVFDELYGEHPKTWAFLAVEKKPPYAVGVYCLNDIDLQVAQAAARRDLNIIHYHKQLGVWPDYGTEPKELVLPSWYRP